MSNRCGHNRKKFRRCDLARRGKGGQPQIIGIMVALLTKAITNPKILKDWQYHKGATGGLSRRRRSELREATIAVLQFLSSQWLQLETRRCAVPSIDFLECPDVKYLARAISRSPEWRGSKLSVGRINAVFKCLEEVGYLKRSKQKREQLANGLWIASPKIISFTKKFFLELGGVRVWRGVIKSGKLKLEKMKHLVSPRIPRGHDINRAMGDYLSSRDVVSPKRARFLREIRPPDWPDDRPHFPKKFKIQEAS